MITLKSLIKESESNGMPAASLKDYLLEHRVIDFSDWVYHGSPYEGLRDMLTQGIHGVEHGEVAEYNTLSTSVNSEVLDYFSEMEGTTGLQFKVENAKIIVLDDILHFLVTQLPGSGVDIEVDEGKLEKFCEQFQIPVGNWKQTPYLPYNYLSSLGVDGFMFDYVWKNYQRGHMPMRDESEICFIGDKGINLLQRSVTGIWVDGHEYEPSQKAAALQDLEGR